jgi:PAS domain S-box-containing protein
MKNLKTVIRFFIIGILLYSNYGIQNLIAQNTYTPKKIIVGVYDNNPKIFTDKKGIPKGIFIDILESIAKSENYTVVYKKGEWNDLLDMLKNGEIDVLPDVAYSKERDSIYSLSSPVLDSWLQVYTTKETVISSIANLNNKRIGVLHGSVQESFMNTTLKKDNNIDYETITFEDYESTVNALKKRKIDVIVANRFFYFSELCDKDILPTGIILQLTDLHFAFPKNKDNKLIKQFNNNIFLQKNNPGSDYYRSLEKWFAKKNERYIPKIMKWGIVFFVLVIILISINVLLLRFRVKTKTKILSQKNLELMIANEKMEESEKKLQQIADHIPNGMIYQAIIDKNNKIFTYFSKAVEKLYGHCAEDAIANPDVIYQRIHPDDVENLLLLEETAIKNMTLFQTEARVFNPDGSIRWSYFVSSPRFQKNKLIFDGIEIDISKQKQVEAELIRAKEKAEESDRLKTVFLQNMSHEVRTPMNGILGFINLMEDAALDAETKKQHIDIINISAQRLLKTINDIIEISKLDSKQVDVVCSKWNISELMHAQYELFYRQAEQKGLKLILSETVKGEKAFIYTDRSILDRILSYLIANAIKFTEKGTIVLGNNTGENKISIYVKDSGIGISPDRLDAIFDRFVQADTNITRPQGGTGLGLSIVKEYIRLLNGSISVESELHKGSTFTITIPHPSV